MASLARDERLASLEQHARMFIYICLKLILAGVIYCYLSYFGEHGALIYCYYSFYGKSQSAPQISNLFVKFILLTVHNAASIVYGYAAGDGDPAIIFLFHSIAMKNLISQAAHHSVIHQRQREVITLELKINFRTELTGSNRFFCADLNMNSMRPSN